jgi:hypothetical protein
MWAHAEVSFQRSGLVVWHIAGKILRKLPGIVVKFFLFIGHGSSSFRTPSSGRLGEIAVYHALANGIRPITNVSRQVGYFKFFQANVSHCPF